MRVTNLITQFLHAFEFEGEAKTPAGYAVTALNGKVEDCEGDNHALAKHLYGKFGYQPIYVQLVTTASPPIYHLSSPRRTVPS